MSPSSDAPPETSAEGASLAGVAGELEARLGEALLGLEEDGPRLVLRVAPEDRPRALVTLKRLGFVYYSFCCGVDWPEEDRFEVIDHVQVPHTTMQATLKCDISRSNPRLPTATKVFAGADWHERETWELFGIVFAGHPGLRRLLLPDWHEGFPMRKDELLAARVEKPWPGDFFSG